MKPSFHLKGSQHLTMTPQLQQSIRLLQLSSVELQQEIAQALMDNPLLERSDPENVDNDGAEPTATPEEAFEAAGDPVQSEAFSREDMPDTAEAFELSSLSDLDEGPYAFSGTGIADSDIENDSDKSNTLTLREHLLAQAGLQRISWHEQALIRLLIEAVDERGYLSSELNEILEALPQDMAIREEAIELALTRLQGFDPAGVGARSLTECLSLQLKDSQHPSAPLARSLVAEYLPLLAQRDFMLLRRKTGADDEALRAAQALIRTLNPNPGNLFLNDASPYIIPDVVVRRGPATQSARWQATTNPDALPRLRINRIYANLLRQPGYESHNLTSQLQEARWLIKNVRQRFETIERVAQAIIDKQTVFFEKGELGMRPLVLREIADQLGLHESTISRVTTQKFMATPRGVFEFKYFFGSHVSSESGGTTSATAIKARIRQLIDDENQKKPLSDQQICDQFMTEGIVVARRTIAKYREAIGIPIASLRKTL